MTGNSQGYSENNEYFCIIVENENFKKTNVIIMERLHFINNTIYIEIKQQLIYEVKNSLMNDNDGNYS